MKKHNILLTGGSGFLGTALLQNVVFEDALVVGRTRPRYCKRFAFFDLSEDCDLTHHLKGIDIVLHVAARAHVMSDNPDEALDLYRDINTLSTINLARQAAKSGVKRFIFLSTIKVQGNETVGGKKFRNTDPVDPKDTYGISKAEAEIGLKNIMDESDMEVVIIRPPLVYGAGVKGNFASLLKLVSKSLPLPFGSFKNRRSFVSVENLIDLICQCLDHPNARNQTFLVSDNHDLSTPELCRLLAETGGYKCHLFPFPAIILRIFLNLLGKKAVYERLFGSSEVDISFTMTQLNWRPPYKLEESIANCWHNKN